MTDHTYRCQMSESTDNFLRRRALEQAIEQHNFTLEATGRRDAAQAEFVLVLLDHGYAPDEFTPEEFGGYLI